MWRRQTLSMTQPQRGSSDYPECIDVTHFPDHSKSPFLSFPNDVLPRRGPPAFLLRESALAVFDIVLAGMNGFEMLSELH